MQEQIGVQVYLKEARAWRLAELSIDSSYLGRIFSVDKEQRWFC